MNNELFSLLSFRWICFAVLISITPAHSLIAELVWNAQTGWRYEGGVLSDYFDDPIEGQNAKELMNKARKAQEAENYGRALGAYEEVRERYDQSIFAPEAMLQSARVYTRRHQFQKAFDLLDQVIQIYPEYEKFNKVVGQQFEIASQVMEGARPKLWGTIPWLRGQRKSLDYFERIIENAPYSRYAPVGLMNIALIAKSNGETDRLIDALDRLITSYPDSALAPDSYLMLAETYANMVQGAEYDQGATRKAVSYYRDFLVLFPEHARVADAEKGLKKMQDRLGRSRLIAGEFYWKYRNNPNAAEIMLNKSISRAPQSAAAKEARSLLERIDSGEKPPTTPVDWLFGEYRSASAAAEKRQSGDQNTPPPSGAGELPEASRSTAPSNNAPSSSTPGAY